MPQEKESRLRGVGTVGLPPVRVSVEWTVARAVADHASVAATATTLVNTSRLSHTIGHPSRRSL